MSADGSSLKTVTQSFPSTATSSTVATDNTKKIPTISVSEEPVKTESQPVLQVGRLEMKAVTSLPAAGVNEVLFHIGPLCEVGEPFERSFWACRVITVPFCYLSHS